MKKHDWRERAEDGTHTYYRATFHGAKWTLHAQGPDDDMWILHDPMTLEELRSVRDVLWRKYQRRRCPWEEVDRFDKFIEEAEKERAEKEAATARKKEKAEKKKAEAARKAAEKSSDEEE
jgi:hypothetical protein